MSGMTHVGHVHDVYSKYGAALYPYTPKYLVQQAKNKKP